LSEGCEAAGYSVATADTAAGTPNRLVEVYPHPALLVLLERSYRFPYKVGRAHRLWPQSDAHGRRAAVLASLHQILKALETRIGGIQSHLAGLPQPTEVTSLASLKRYEDAVDALVCCWVGMEYLEGRAEALGDEKAAIWVPAEARERARRAASTEGRP
jgi:predicted RNase H-like nuclease